MTNWATYPVTHGYITSYEGPDTDTPHYAEDIGTPFHTPITAILPGTVKVADYQGWGGEIFIQPDDPSYPEYYFYHPDLLEVKKGDHVTAGEEIALSGGENPGYPGAEHPALPEWSSGPHTHVGWFEKWQTTPIGTRPYGPDPSDLIDMAKGDGTISPPPGGTEQLSSTSSTTTCVAPSGLNIANPIAWQQYWACQAQNAVTGSAQSVESGIASWIGSTIGPFMMRLGVGIAGLALIWMGGNEIVSGLKGESGTQGIEQDKAKGEKAAAPDKQTDTSEKEKSTGSKKKAASKKEADADSGEAGAGASESEAAEAGTAGAEASEGAELAALA